MPSKLSALSSVIVLSPDASSEPKFSYGHLVEPWKQIVFLHDTYKELCTVPSFRWILLQFLCDIGIYLCKIFFFIFFSSLFLWSYHINLLQKYHLGDLIILVVFHSYHSAFDLESVTRKPLTVDEPSEVLQRLQLESIGMVLSLTRTSYLSVCNAACQEMGYFGRQYRWKYK